MFLPNYDDEIGLISCCDLRQESSFDGFSMRVTTTRIMYTMIYKTQRTEKCLHTCIRLCNSVKVTVVRMCALQLKLSVPMVRIQKASKSLNPSIFNCLICDANRFVYRFPVVYSRAVVYKPRR